MVRTGTIVLIVSWLIPVGLILAQEENGQSGTSPFAVQPEPVDEPVESETQPDPAESPTDAESTAPATSAPTSPPPASSSETLTPPPSTTPKDYPYMPFVRGNGQGQAGFYLNLALLVPVLGMFLLWVYTTDWAREDSQQLKVRPAFWLSLIFGCGLLGFLLVVLLPFLLGSLLMLAAYGVPLGMYIVERNQKVPASARVMTPRHIRAVTHRLMAKAGMKTGDSDAPDAPLGPPIVFIGKSSTGRGDEVDRSRQVESSRGYIAAREMIYDSIQRRGTDIHLEPKEDQMAVRTRIDGVMYPGEPFERPMGEAITNIFKVLGGMDITERRRPQDGSFRAELEGRQIDFRVATQGTRFGEKMSLRILDQANSVSKVADLGLRKRLAQQLVETINSPHGLMLVCGPTGAGKSTTLYSALNEIDTDQRNVITVEDPIEYKMDGVNQIEINTKAGQTFANSLRSILRQDPDVVMIGEIRDAETGEIACQAANTGHMVFSTIHANDTITALYRLQELGVEPYMVANSISGIIGQRLARRLCPKCRQPYKPAPDLLKKLHLPADKIDKLYRPPKNGNDCEYCGGLGFRGRIGVFEFLQVTDRMRDLIRDKAPMSEIMNEARQNGMLSMKEEGLRLVARGTTSVEEMLRVVK